MSRLLEVLEEFGTAADAGDYPAMEVGGFLVPGAGSTSTRAWGKEDEVYARVSAGPQAGGWEGPRAQAASSGASAPAVERDLASELRLSELLDYHPDTRWFSGSAGYTLAYIPLGLFRGHGGRSGILLEVPVKWVSWLQDRRRIEAAPPLRCWGYGQAGLLVRSAHQYPDFSICAFMSGEWRFGRDSIEDLVGYYACWLAKNIHLHRLGRWPGRQHLGELARVQNGRPSEFCGCGSGDRYVDCHQQSDAAISFGALVMMEKDANNRYLEEIKQRGLPLGPPAMIL